MTAREKLAMEHPGENIDKLCHDNCPEDYGYLGRFGRCPKDSYEWNAAVVCPKCWNREVPERRDCSTCLHAYTPVDASPCNEFKEGVRKQVYSLFMKEMTTNGTRYKLLAEKKDLTTVSERVKHMVISGTPIDDLCIVKNVEFEFECTLKFKEDE